MGLSLTQMLPLLNRWGALKTCGSWGALPCPQHPVGMQGAWVAPHCTLEPAQSAMGTNSLGCSALLCPQDFHAVGESCSPRTHHRNGPGTRSSSRAPDMQGNTSLGTGPWMLLLLQPRWSFPTAQDRRSPGLAGTPASHTPPLPRSLGCTGCTHIFSVHPGNARTRTQSTYLHCSMQGGLAPGCTAAGLERQLLSAPSSDADPLLDLASPWYLGGCSQGEVGQAPRRGG